MRQITSLIIALLFIINAVQAKVIVILNNAEEYDKEFEQIQAYLQEMQITDIEKIVEEQDGEITIDKIQYASLVIVDDMGHYGKQLEPQTISAVNSFYNIGKPVYFIGDDLACNIQNTQKLSGLLHLSSCSSNGYSTEITITDTDNPLMNGEYGLVSNFSYYKDIDVSTTLNNGEKVVALSSNNNPAILFYEDKARVVVQLPNVYVSDIIIADNNGLNELKKLFQNSVAWLLGKASCDDRYDEGFLAGKEYCKNNPSACGITTGGSSTGAGIISANLDIYAPSLNYTSLTGTQNIWVNLKFLKEENGQFYWTLKDYGLNQ